MLFLVLFLNSICFGQMPTRHCPKHMIPFSRISIQRTSTNQICETPYLNECKNVIPTTSTNHKLSHLTSSIHEFHLDTYEATHEIYTSPSLGSLALALKAGGPRFFPPKSAASFSDGQHARAPLPKGKHYGIKL